MARPRKDGFTQRVTRELQGMAGMGGGVAPTGGTSKSGGVLLPFVILLFFA